MTVLEQAELTYSPSDVSIFYSISCVLCFLTSCFSAETLWLNEEGGALCHFWEEGKIARSLSHSDMLITAALASCILQLAHGLLPAPSLPDEVPWYGRVPFLALGTLLLHNCTAMGWVLAGCAGKALALP